MSRYDAEVRKVFKEMKPPYKGFVVDLVEWPNTLTLRIYRPNVDDYSQSQKVVLAEYLYRLRDSIRDLGVKCEIEGVENAPPNKT